VTAFFEKISSAIRTFGVFDGALYSLDRFLGQVGGPRIFRYYLVAQPVPPLCGNEKLMAGVAARFLAPGDPALALFPLTPEVLRYRFEQGALCLGVWRKDALLGCFWMVQGAYLEDEVRCRFLPVPQGSVWDFDVYLLPQHRLGRGFVQLWEAAFAHMRAIGAGWSISRISGFNPRSLASHRAMGARIVGSVTYLKGKNRQLMIGNRPPFLHYSGKGGKAPALRVKAPAPVSPEERF
jgi:hypothetical protein